MTDNAKTDQPEQRAIFNKLFNESTELCVETIKELGKGIPLAEKLVEDYERRVAQGENIGLYLVGENVWLGPKAPSSTGEHKAHGAPESMTSAS